VLKICEPSIMQLRPSVVVIACTIPVALPPSSAAADREEQPPQLRKGPKPSDVFAAAACVVLSQSPLSFVLVVPPRDRGDFGLPWPLPSYEDAVVNDVFNRLAPIMVGSTLQATVSSPQKASPGDWKFEVTMSFSRL